MLTVAFKLVIMCTYCYYFPIHQWTRDNFGLGIGRDLAGFPFYSMRGGGEAGDYSLHIREVSLQDDAKCVRIDQDRTSH